MRNGEDQPEADRPPVPLEVVLDDELDGMLCVHAAFNA